MIVTANTPTNVQSNIGAAQSYKQLKSLYEQSMWLNMANVDNDKDQGQQIDKPIFSQLNLINNSDYSQVAHVIEPCQQRFLVYMVDKRKKDLDDDISNDTNK